jgi:phosphate acyltransferase
MIAQLDWRADGSPEEENIEVTPRQAPGDASPRGSARERVPGLPPAEAAASRLSELQDVQGPRRRAADRSRAVVARIAVDALGGDRGPAEVIAGALEASRQGIDVVLYGPETLDAQGLELVQASEKIEMHEKPADAVRAKPDSSLVSACRAVGAGEADGVVSAGNTGAMLAAGLLHIRRLPGVMRPAIAVVVPARSRPSVLIDAGANADSRAEHLVQFAHMGSVFAQEILEVQNPEVRLLSIGEEPEKGNQLTLEAHEALTGSGLNFLGNTEARDLLRGAADVVVTDGFTGNIALKLLEGTISELLAELRDEIGSSMRGKVGGLLIRPAARRLRTRLDPDTYGGAYLLGLRGLSVVAHGNSSSRAVTNAIRLAARGVDHQVVERLSERLPDRVASARS